MVVFFIEEELVSIYDCWNDKKVEVVKDFLLFKLPVVIMKVVINPHEPLVNHLGNNRFLGHRMVRDGELYLEPCTEPIVVETLRGWE